MRSRRWIAGPLAVLALLLAQGAAADQSYSDPAGDATGGAPDITTIAVTNDGAGKLTFDLTVAGLPASSTYVQVNMNTDMNASTGDDGVDYGFELVGVAGIGLLYRWDGSKWVVHAVSSARGSYANGVVHFEVNRADIGNPTTFFWWGSSFKTSGDQVLGYDDAPDGTAVYTYTLAQFPACSDKIDNDGDGKIDSADPGCSSAADTDETDPPPLSLTAGKPAGAGLAKAGAAFTVSMAVTRSDGKPFSGQVSCKAKAGAATLVAAGRASAGSARCTMRLPKTAKGKKLTGSITATAGSATVTKPYAFPIR